VEKVDLEAEGVKIIKKFINSDKLNDNEKKAVESVLNENHLLKIGSIVIMGVFSLVCIYLTVKLHYK